MEKMNEEMMGVDLIIEVHDDDGTSVEWNMFISRPVLEKWERADLESPDQGMGLVRLMVASDLRANDPNLWAQLVSTTTLDRYVVHGITEQDTDIHPELGLLNEASRKVYDGLSNLVLEAGIRIGH